jgi:hypothetical protein
MATRPATGRLSWPWAMQLNSRIAEGARLTPVRYLLTGLCATGFSDLDARRRTLVPIIAVAAAREPAQTSALRVIELYQGLVRVFQRCGKCYEHRCGQLYARTIAVVADRR